MNNIPHKLRQDIQAFLLNIYSIDIEESRKQIGREADFPELLQNQIEWGKQPAEAFVTHLLGRTLQWGTFSGRDSRHALIEYLAATEKLGGGEHEKDLSALLKTLKDELMLQKVAKPGRQANTIPEVKFVNREQEIRDLTDESSPFPRHAIHAPAGYGKTWLLTRLQYEFRRGDWLTLYTIIDKNTSNLSLTNNLLESIQSPGISESVLDISQLGSLFAGELKNYFQHSQKPHKGIVLLIDFADLLIEVPIFLNLITGWLPDVAKSIYGLQFFSSEKSRLRIILSGRFFDNNSRRLVQYGEIQFRIYPLSPLVDHVLERSVGEYLPDLSFEWRVELWSSLFFFTGGHPGCSSKILQLYWQQLQPEPDLFYHKNANKIQEMVLEEVKVILRDFPETTRQLLLALSHFRYLSYGVLEEILKYENEIVDWLYGPLELADYLTETHLVAWDESGYLLRDDITRRIMALYMRYSEVYSQLFSARCIQAKEIYKRRLINKEEAAPPARWAIEYLYQSLQAQVPKSQTPDGRSEIREAFWGTTDETAPRPGTDLHECLLMLVLNRDALVQTDALQRALDNDWELHFTLNYFFRGKTYETKWFGILLAKIRAFVSAQGKK
jgi:hypothetical protein